MRRLPSGAALLAIVVSLVLMSAPAQAQDGPEPEAPSERERVAAGFVDVVQVSGLIDPVLVAFVTDAIERAEADGSRGLVLQLNSHGAVVGDDELADLARAMVEADVPVSVWVGPTGSDARGAAAELVAVAGSSGMAPGTRLGAMGEQRLPIDEFGVLFGEAHDRLAEDVVDEDEAMELGAITVAPPEDEGSVRGDATIGDFLANLDEVVTRVDRSGDQPRTQLVTVTRFSRLPLLDQLMHTVASPAVAYLLFVVGMGLIIFELYTAGVGIAGVVGAASFLLGCYGLAALPTEWFGIALLVVAMIAFAIDVQTGVPYVWTWIGFVAFAGGTVTLYDGVSMSWVTVVAAWIGVLLTFTVGMPAMVRTRFSTPTIGREWMIGELGEASTDVDPDGVVLVRGAPWKARTNRATPIARGDRVRVVSLEALLLEVEPEEGGAEDYREKYRKGDDESAAIAGDDVDPPAG